MNVIYQCFTVNDTMGPVLFTVQCSFCWGTDAGNVINTSLIKDALFQPPASHLPLA